MSTTAVTAPTASRTSIWRHATLALSLAAPVLAGRVIGVWAAPLLPFVFGAICLRSLLVGRPFMTAMAERTGRPAELNAPRVQRSLRGLTAVWGAVMVAEAVGLAVLAATLPSATFAVANPAISYGVPAALGAATFLSVRRCRARAAV